MAEEVVRQGVDGRIAAVTGGSRGIGRVVGDLLRRHGARVAYLDIRPPGADESVEESDSALFAECDVTSQVSIDLAFALVEDRWGSVEILVNNAGIFSIEAIAATTLEAWERMFAVNSTGPFLCTQRVLPAMRSAGWGRIVSIGSSAGKTGGAKNVAAYGASKAAVMAFAKAVATECAADGVTSNALAPALIETDMVAGIADLVSSIPVGRLGQPADVANAVLFLASSEASFITGEVMDVNGGFLID